VAHQALLGLTFIGDSALPFERGVAYNPVKENRVTEARYISQAERARRLIDKAVRAWQRLQAFAMEHDELVDSLVLRGQELWLPHHETDARKFRATLLVDLHYPTGLADDPRAPVAQFIQGLEVEFSDDEGTLAIRVESA
jgi:hypothetical protein